MRKERHTARRLEEKILGYLACTVGNGLRDVPKLSFTWTGYISSYRWRHKEFLILASKRVSRRQEAGGLKMRLQGPLMSRLKISKLFTSISEDVIRGKLCLN